MIRQLLTVITLGSALSLASVQANENLDFNYQYQGTPAGDLSSMTDGPIVVGDFSDGRGLRNPTHFIIDGNHYTLEKPLAEYVRDAMHGALQAGGAQLGDTGTRITLTGTVTELSGRVTDAGIELMLRCDTVLNKQGRNAWQSTLFSRVQTESTDMGEALAEALDNLSRDIFWDDYFRMELGIF
jgi:hypothetical protein